MTQFTENGQRFTLTSPTLLPNSASYLWNDKMMLHMNCQGYAVAQYMDPEPRKYAHVPNLAATSFMQPEQPYFAHHPGRFFYVRDEDTGELFSAPFAPIKQPLDSYEFKPGINDIQWVVKHRDIELTITLSLSPTHALEQWTVTISNIGASTRNVSLVPYFPVGYMSWMNMGAHFDDELNAIVCTSISPYQKLEDYPEIKERQDMTFFACSHTPDHVEMSIEAFEGQSGLHAPHALVSGNPLSDREAHYQMPACAAQYELSIESQKTDSVHFLFGPAKDRAQIEETIAAHFDKGAIANKHQLATQPILSVSTPDANLDHVINHWLPRQVAYHGETNRLTTDPQTRNYLQDGMGMAYLAPDVAKQVIVTSLSQQKRCGEMPDGILLTPEATLKYINQIPHTDHSVWLVLILESYLNETNDWALLEEAIPWADSDQSSSLLEHMNLAMQSMVEARDDRGLPYILQGDWCDPMNMVGPKGKGVSGWLTQALCFALRRWNQISKSHNQATWTAQFDQIATELEQACQKHFWTGGWFARGITDDDVTFGVPEDKEGRIFLNTQSWALLADIASPSQQTQLLSSVDEQLLTPYGVMLCAPAFTAMREDVGRVTQKWPGSGENGSVYNHAAAFYAAGLYHIGESERAYHILKSMLADPQCETFERRGQLPTYIPNYYRGAYHQFPDTAGRSSHLFNTGTSAWYYRLVIEELFGLKGTQQGLKIAPNLPVEWDKAAVSRHFRGAIVNLSYQRHDDVQEITILCEDGDVVDGVLCSPEQGKTYSVTVLLPFETHTYDE
jgi:cellobionic acid phosphorylase